MFTFLRSLNNRSLKPVRCGLALASFVAAGTVALSAQSAVQAAAAAAAAQNQVQPALELAVPRLDPASVPLFSSSSAEEETTPATQVAALKPIGVNFADAMQYGGGGRSRYGRPRYRGANTNADGSPKYTFFAGVGLASPVGNTNHYDTLSYSYQVGVGRNFNRHVGVNLQFDWDNFGLQGRTLQQQAYIEDPTNQYSLQGNTDGYSHVWSFSLDPIYNIYSGEGLGAYVVGGVGFFHKITTFTTPEQGTICYYFCYTVVANEPFDSYTSNAPGVDAGFGLTYKFSRFSNERLYGEVRYVVVFNSQRAGINASNYNKYAPNYDYPTYNLYPANSNRTTYFPVKFGIRF